MVKRKIQKRNYNAFRWGNYPMSRSQYYKTMKELKRAKAIEKQTVDRNPEQFQRHVTQSQGSYSDYEERDLAEIVDTQSVHSSDGEQAEPIMLDYNSSEGESTGNGDGNAFMDILELFNTNEEPLYEGSKVSKHKALFIIQNVFIEGKLSMTTKENIIKALNKLLPEDHVFPKSLYLFEKYFSYGNYEKVYYCQVCNYKFKTEDKICQQCEKGSRRTSNVSISFKLQEVVQEIITNQLDELKSTLLLRNSESDHYKDIYDGEVYGRLVDEGKLGEIHQFSFLLNTDGVKLHNRSKNSWWASWIVINELPLNVRYKKENIKLIHLWSGSSKPNLSEVLHNVIQNFKECINGWCY